MSDPMPCIVRVGGALGDGVLIPGVTYRVAEVREFWEPTGGAGEEPTITTTVRFEPAALSTTPAPSLDAAWAAAEAALAPNQRLVMWQDRGGPRFVQVLAPDPTITDDDGEPVDDVMAPVISILADYPSKGLGQGVVVELLALAGRLREARP